jgi:hypothetical protein
MERTFECRDDDWNTEGARITDPAVVARLRKILEDESPLIVEHRFYLGASSPHWFVLTNGDELEEYLRSRTRPGDSIYMWNFGERCRTENAVALGKVPNVDGEVPRRGAY